MSKKEFPDVSFYQVSIDWEKLRAKTDNLIMRCGQGSWIDSRFEEWYQAAKTYGFIRGIYQFFDDRYSPGDHMAVMKKLMDKYGLPETRIWIDWESLSYHTKGVYKGIRQPVSLMEAIEKHYPEAAVGMYTGYYWFRDNTNPAKDAAPYKYLGEHPLWLSQFTKDGSSDPLMVPKPWSYPPELHQWGTPAIGREWGVGSEEIDMNRVLTNESIYTGVTPPAPQEPVPPQGIRIIDKDGITWLATQFQKE